MQMIRYTSSSGTIALGFLQNGQLIGHLQPGVELHHLLRLAPLNSARRSKSACSPDSPPMPFPLCWPHQSQSLRRRSLLCQDLWPASTMEW